MLVVLVAVLTATYNPDVLRGSAPAGAEKALFWQRHKNQSTINWPKKSLKSLTQQHCADAGGLMRWGYLRSPTSSDAWLQSRGKQACCAVDISLFLSTLSSSYPSLCAPVFSIQVLGSWEASQERVSPSARQGHLWGICALWPFPTSLAPFPCVCPSIQAS